MVERNWKCPVCGGIDTELVDKYYTDEGVRVDCDSCGCRTYVKSEDDLDYVEVEMDVINSNKLVKGKAYRRRVNRLKAIRKLVLYKEINKGKDIKSKVARIYGLYDNINQYSKNKIHKRKCVKNKDKKMSVRDMKHIKLVLDDDRDIS